MGMKKQQSHRKKIIHLVIGGCCFWCFSCCLCNLIYDNIANTGRHSARSVSECLWIKKTYATNPPKKATGPPPMSRILRWHESNSDDRACAGGDGWVCMPIMPPDVGPWPTMCEGDRNMLFSRCFQILLLVIVGCFLCVLVWFGFFQTLFFFSLLFLCCRSYILHFNHTNTPEQWEKKTTNHNKTPPKQKQTKNKQINKWKIIVTIKSTAHARTHACAHTFVSFQFKLFSFGVFLWVLQLPPSLCAAIVARAHGQRDADFFPSTRPPVAAAIICNFQIGWLFVLLFCLICMLILFVDHFDNKIE